MTLGRKALTDKIFVLGVDGLDPRLTRKLVDEGKMPNVKKYLERGSARDDLAMLGAQPTITPPMWTTMATGAYPCTHGITCFRKQSKDSLDTVEYALDSRYCKAEQLWNVFAEAGKRTLVWHWPGSSWPPTSDSPNLHVVDGTQPGFINNGTSIVDAEKVLVASEKTEDVLYKKKAASDSNIPCVINDLNVEESDYNLFDVIATKKRKTFYLSTADGEGAISDSPFDINLSPIKEAAGWENAPEGAKEFTLLHSGGLTRRPCLILKNAEGIYDQVAIYKSKREKEPIVVLKNNVFTENIIDEAIKNDKKYTANRNMRVLELSPAGDYIKMWISPAMDIENNVVWHPHSLYSEITRIVGPVPPTSMVGGGDRRLITDCMLENWNAGYRWQAGALKYLMDNDKYDVIFSHFHNIDLQGHFIVKYLKNGHGDKLSAEDYQKMMEDIYVQTDNYLGEYLYLLDKGWTIIILSDHAQVCPDYEVPLIGESGGVNVRVMEELGYTALKKDAAGNELKELDWSKTRAVAVRGNHIYINLKGRDQYGIVDPADKYELEEEIMTALYGCRDQETGKRVIALALRNKDAFLLGMGGEESGDILYWVAEGYNRDHGDCLSTTYGFADTSVSPIFIAAGKGIKEGFTTERIIRQVDVAPTLSALGGVRMSAECEGAPVYQILSEEF